MTAIILAAGKSNRINLSLPKEERREYFIWVKRFVGDKFPIPEDSFFPKVILPLGDKPLVTHILEKVRSIGIARIIVVINPNFPIIKEVIKKTFPFPNISFVYQEKPLGTADAVLSCASSPLTNDVLVLCGDTPLLQSSTLSLLMETHKKEDADLTFLTAFLERPQGYGRIWKEGKRISIVEERDANEKQKEIKEINAGVYLFKWQKVFPYLKAIKPLNLAGEYYLTDVVNLLSESGGKIRIVPTSDPQEILGVNNREEYLNVKALFISRNSNI